jgi:uncharacterized membrane protein HdeD (DUF308 family)
MSTTAQPPELMPLQVSWGWYVGLGVLFVLLGLVGLSMVYVLTAICVIIGGYLLVFGGVAQIVGGCFTRPFRSALLQILAGILYLIAGAFVISHPYLAEVIFTAVIAVSLIMNGAMRIILAFLHRRFVTWLALVFSGVITMILGLYILSLWQWTSMWVIGMFFAIDLIFQGISWIVHGVNMRQANTMAPITPSM